MSKLPKPTLAEWGDMLKRATDYANESPSWWFAAAQVDAGQAIQRDLQPWHQRLKDAGCDAVPEAPSPPPKAIDLSTVVTPLAQGFASIPPLLVVIAAWYFLRDRRR
jgi:hypothetical protein